MTGCVCCGTRIDGKRDWPESIYRVHWRGSCAGRRRVAGTLDLALTGTVGILMKAKISGKIPSLRSVLHTLSSEFGFFPAPRPYPAGVP